MRQRKNTHTGPPAMERAKPWAAAGMSRASWYRHGKPVARPMRATMEGRAKEAGASVRTLYRAQQVQRGYAGRDLRAKHWREYQERQVNRMVHLYPLETDAQIIERVKAHCASLTDDQLTEIMNG